MRSSIVHVPLTNHTDLLLWYQYKLLQWQKNLVSLMYLLVYRRNPSQLEIYCTMPLCLDHIFFWMLLNNWSHWINIVCSWRYQHTEYHNTLRFAFLLLTGLALKDTQFPTRLVDFCVSLTVENSKNLPIWASHLTRWVGFEEWWGGTIKQFCYDAIKLILLYYLRSKFKAHMQAEHWTISVSFIHVCYSWYRDIFVFNASVTKYLT